MKKIRYSLGLDIGTTSVGWAVINEDKKRIEDLGVRIFERPEDPKTSESLAKPRREARSTRRRIKRRKQRLNYLKRFFIENKLLTKEQLKNIFSSNNNPYKLREKALNQVVSNEELFVALYHIAKRRGYKSNRKKVEESAKEGDSKKVLGAVKENQALLAKYESVAAALNNAEKFTAKKRNSTNSYQSSFIREDFEKEILAILRRQNWSEEKIKDLLYKENYGLFYQRPFMTKDLLNKMRGNCEFEPNEKRAWKASFTFEFFRLSQDLANLTYGNGNKLTEEQILDCIEEAKNIQSVKYAKIRKVIGLEDSSIHFDYIRGKQKETYEETEKNEFCNLRFYHDIRKACKNSPADWEKIKDNDGEYGEEKVGIFDEIGRILTFNKDDNSVEKGLRSLKLEQNTIDELMKLSYSTFGHLSIKALKKLTPHLQKSLTYDKAVEIEYPNQFTAKLSGDKNKLPPLSEKEQNQITNPVVKRAISQTRKVVNAIIDKYGPAYQIKIETTNELAKSAKQRKEIEKKQKDNAAINEKIVKILQEDFGVTTPRGLQITKYKLREQQDCKCMYCGNSIPIDLGDERQTEIDHIIPFSRCGNDSLINKVLVCSKCNQEKSNKTPFEKWGDDEKRWRIIQQRANDKKIPFKKRDRILAEKAPEEEWNARALNDTRYIMKFMSQYIKKNLQFSEDSKGMQKVILPTGSITSYLRKRYGLGQKDRELNNAHHAVDACIIATVSQEQIRKLAVRHKYEELGPQTRIIEWTDKETGEIFTFPAQEYRDPKFILPWENFDKEVVKRSGMTHDAGKVEKLEDFKDKFREFKSYDEDFLQTIHPLFVSRMPKRGVKGQAHKETVRSPRKNDKGAHLVKKPIEAIEEKHLDDSILPESDKALYNQLKDLFKKHGKDAIIKEIKENGGIWKNNKKIDKNGKPISPISAIKVYEGSDAGIYMNNKTQFVNNGSTAFLNIYKKNVLGAEKYFAAPVYTHLLKSDEIEILPTPKGSKKEEKAEFEKLKTPDGKIFGTAENGFEKIMQIHPNDYVRFIYENKIVEGYYVKYNINGGRVSLIPHNQANKDNLIVCSLGSVKEIQKLDISVLGDNYKEV